MGLLIMIIMLYRHTLRAFGERLEGPLLSVRVLTVFFRSSLGLQDLVVSEPPLP